MTQKSLIGNEIAVSLGTEKGYGLKDFLEILGHLADDAGLEGYQSLQDACLLLMEAVGERVAEGAPGVDAGFLALIDTWPSLVVEYHRQGQPSVAELIRFLRQPTLNLPMAEEEFVLLESQLLAEAPAPADDLEPSQEDAIGPLPPAAAERVGQVDHYLALMESLAVAAGREGCQALQDSCLLLQEMLGERGAAGPELLRLLDGWPALVDAYYADPHSAVAAIVEFLRRPEWALPLTETEFSDLETMLREALGADSQAALAAFAYPRQIETEARPSSLAESIDRQSQLSLFPKKARELLELLLLQSDLIQARLQAVGLDAPSVLGEALQEVHEQVERFANASNTVGFGGLALACEFIGTNLRAWLASPSTFDATGLDLLETWLAQAQRYLLFFNEADAGQQFLILLVNPQWPQPLTAQAGAAMLEQLQGVDINDWGKDESSREQTATAADVSLALPDDVNRDLLDILLQELPIQARQLSESVQKLQAGGGGLAEIEVAQRIAHTLKGSANTVGIKGLAVLTHHLEDILLACAKEDRLPGPRLVAALIDATDSLEAMSDALLGRGEPPTDAQAVLQAVLDWANRIDRDGLVEAEQAAPILRETPPETHPATSTEAGAGTASASVLRVSRDVVDNLFRLSGEGIILNSQAQEQLRRIGQQLQAMQTQFELLRQLGADLDALIDLKDLSGRALGHAGQDFDALEMDQYNELHTASRRMVEAAVDAREFGLDARKELDFLEEVLSYQQNLVIDSQTALMQTKLSPVDSIVPRLQRSLRQTCRLTGKPAELSLAGGQLLIDGDTVNALVDPLMHVLRNAVDHGIESEAERLAVGKPAQGKIAFEFESDGNHILVRCRDDGRGLDLGAIRAAAEKRGLVQPGQAVSREELERFILRPNFSSRTESTQTSGRGVGMDVVRAQILDLGGSLGLHSVPGKGLTIELRVPLPLSRIHALLAQAGQYQVVLSNQGVSQVFFAGACETVEVAGGQHILLDGQSYPLVKLNELLHVTEQRREQRPQGAVLLVRNDESRVAVLVDCIIESRDVVIKSLGPYVTKIPGIMGATILGDGTVTPVIDIPELLRAPVSPARVGTFEVVERLDASESLPHVLVVDDSLSNRRALEQLLTDAGFKVRTAYDGVEAAELFALAKPDIVLTDMEMPRMNGIELAAHIRTHPAGKTLPIIMITSRTTQRHRKLAEEAGIDFYLAKPVREDDLLDKIRQLLASQPGWGRAA